MKRAWSASCRSSRTPAWYSKDSFRRAQVRRRNKRLLATPLRSAGAQRYGRGREVHAWQTLTGAVARLSSVRPDSGRRSMRRPFFLSRSCNSHSSQVLRTDTMAGLIEAIEIKRKMFFEFEGAPYHCLDVDVSKPTARGGQTLVRIKMRNLLTRAVFDKTFKAGEKFGEPDLVTVDGVVPLRRQRRLPLHGPGELRDADARAPTWSATTALLLVDNVMVQIQKFNGNPIGLQFPPHVELTVTSHRARRPRRHRQRRRHQSRHARNRPRDPRPALHQGRREGEGAHRDPRVRRAGVTIKN